MNKSLEKACSDYIIQCEDDIRTIKNNKCCDEKKKAMIYNMLLNAEELAKKQRGKIKCAS
jgi:hypothetical protein